MKGNLSNRGQSIIGIIIVLVTVGLISGGVYYYFSKQTPETSEIPEIIQKETPSSSEEVLEEEKKSEETFTTSQEKALPPEPETTCQNECSSAGVKRCSGNGYQICGNYDADECLEWGTIVACPPTTICQNEDCIQQKTIAIFIDKDTYGKLTEEIIQYSNDIANELNVNVKLISEGWKINQIPDPQIFEVKDKLKDLYKNNDLLGAVLIGNVPMAWFDSEETLTGGQTGDYVSDYWYMNIDGNFQDTDNDEMFNWETNYHEKQESLPEIWIGRIKPPVTDQEGINLLKSYFERNHKYRTGALPNNKKILWFHTIALTEENDVFTGGNLERWYKETGAYDSINWSKVWKTENVDIVFDNSPDKEERLKKASQQYLNKLQNNQYEFVAFAGHGTESFHEYKIYSEDIKSIKPKVYFGVFASCTLGDYSSENYIGGWYLFAGNGLTMMTRTFPSLGGAPNIQDLYLLVNGGGLNQGKIFGEAFKYHVGYISWQATALLGDPTLRLLP